MIRFFLNEKYLLVLALLVVSCEKESFEIVPATIEKFSVLETQAIDLKKKTPVMADQKTTALFDSSAWTGIKYKTVPASSPRETESPTAEIFVNKQKDRPAGPLTKKYYKARKILLQDNNPFFAIKILRDVNFKNGRRRFFKGPLKAAHLDEAASLLEMARRAEADSLKKKYYLQAKKIYDFFIRAYRKKPSVNDKKLLSTAYYNRAVSTDYLFKLESTQENKLLLHQAWRDYLHKSKKYVAIPTQNLRYAQARLKELKPGLLKSNL